MESDVIFSRLKIRCKTFRFRFQISDFVLLSTIFSEITQNTKKENVLMYIQLKIRNIITITYLRPFAHGKYSESFVKPT